MYWLEKLNDFAEFKVHLIHRKQVPLLHNKVLILCAEGAGLVAVTNLKLTVCLTNHHHLIFWPYNISPVQLDQGSHRLEKYLNIQDCLEESLKIKVALKST